MSNYLPGLEPDFDVKQHVRFIGGMPVCYAGFSANCKEYKKKPAGCKEEMPAGHGE